MTRHTRTRASFSIVVMALLAAGAIARGTGQGLPPSPGKSPGSAATVPLVGWKDLETWSHQVGSGPDTELGIGFHLAGRDTTGRESLVSTSFAVTRLRNAPQAAVKEVVVTLIPAFDARRVQWFNLTFTAAGRDKKTTKIDASNRITTYPPGPFAPGDGPVNGHASLTAKEFVVLADAVQVSGTILNAPVTFRPDQLKALREFGQRVGLLPPGR